MSPKWDSDKDERFQNVFRYAAHVNLEKNVTNRGLGSLEEVIDHLAMTHITTPYRI